MRSLALLRVFVGPIVLLHLPRLSDSLDGGSTATRLYEPYAAWSPELPRGVYVALLWLAARRRGLHVRRLLTRLATATTFAIVAYDLFLSTTHFHDNRRTSASSSGCSPWRRAGGSCPSTRSSVAAAACRARSARALLAPVAAAVRVLDCLRSLGGSKLLDPDWFGGTVPWMRAVQFRDEVGALPSWVISILTNRDLYTARPSSSC